ncbi:MAG: hypothetical protein Q7U76_04445 [Nitrospirota bacterium]|nr:hypothetical protein [Nitrospirota bacterium]
MGYVRPTPILNVGMIATMLLGAVTLTWLQPALAVEISLASEISGSKLREEADDLMKNAEEMVAHGGMGDTKAIVHHCGQVSTQAEAILKSLPPTDPHGTEAQPYLLEAIKQCRRVADLGDWVDPGASLNPAIKARAAVREAVKHLAAVRESGA